MHVRLLCNKLTNIVQHVLGISKASHVTNTVEQTNLASIVFSDLKNWQLILLHAFDHMHVSILYMYIIGKP